MTSTLVIDQGTHASRAIVFSASGKILSTAEQNIKLIKHSHSHIEQDPEEILQSVYTVIHHALKKTPGIISNCALATQRSTMLAWDKHSLKSLHPALGWQDRRSENDLQQFKSNEKMIREITGLPLSAHYGAGKFRWLLEYLKLNTSDSCPSFSLGPLVSFLLCHLSSKHQNLVDHSNAHRTLLFDLYQLEWSEKLLELFEIDKKYLPVCQPVQSDYGTLMETGIPVTCVSGDQNAALFSQGSIPDNTAIINLGTGAFILTPCQRTVKTDKLLQGIARSNSHTEYLLEGTVNGAGAAISWAERQWPVTRLYQHLSDWLSAIDHPPVFINTVGGLGSPWWISGIEPYFLNTDQQPAIEQRYVAIIESIIFLLQHNLEQLNEHFDIRTLRVSGGLSQMDGLCQKLANLSGCQVQRSDDTEATARGAAWLAASCPEHWSSPVAARVFSPLSDTPLKQRYQRFSEEISRF